MSSGEELFMDNQNGPTWVGSNAQHDNSPFYYDPETGEAMYPGYTYHNDPEVSRVGDFNLMPTIPRSVHPVRGAQNTREGMISAGKTHSETHFDPATGIVTEIWDNPVQEGEIRNQSFSMSNNPDEVRALPAFRFLQGYDRHVPIVQPSEYRQEDPVPDDYNTEQGYYEIARQQVENRIRTDNNILNDYRPPQVWEVAGVIEPDIRIRPYAPNTFRNTMNREIVGPSGVYSDASMMRQGITSLGDSSVQTLQTGDAGRGGAEEIDSRRFTSYSGFLADDKAPSMRGSSASLFPPGATYSVESVGGSSISADSGAVGGGGMDEQTPSFGAMVRRAVDKTVSNTAAIARSGGISDFLPPQQANETVANRTNPKDTFTTQNIARNAAFGSFQPTRAVQIPGALNREEITFGRVAPSTPQWDSHGVHHGRLARRPNEAVRERIHSQGVGNRFGGDAVGEVATGTSSSQIMRNHDMRGQFVASSTHSYDVGRTMVSETLRDQQGTARPRQPSVMSL